MSAWRIIIAAAICLFAGPTLAQQGLGQIPAWNIVGNPSASQAPTRSATVTQMLDGAFCQTPGSSLLRGASAWACTVPTVATVDVRVFGAMCDGTTDDAAALQTAINSGRNLFFPAMCGVGTAGLLVNGATNQVLDGGRTGGIKALGVSVRTLSSFGSTTLAVSASSGVAIRNMRFDGNGFASAPVGLYQCTECRIEGNVVTSGGAVATVYTIGSIRTVVANNLIKNNIGTSTRGLSIGNSNSNEFDQFAIVTGNILLNLVADGIGMTAYGATIANNIVDTCGASGIIITAFATGGTASRTTVTGNVFRNCAFQGIQSDAFSGRVGPGVDIVGNVAENNAGCGIFVINATAWTVVGNQANDNGTGGASACQAGITVGASDHISISGNQVYNTTAGASRTQQSGILVLAQTGALDTSDVAVSGNNAWNNTGVGIAVESSGPGTFRNVSVTGNTSTANSTYGFFAAEVAAGDNAGLVVDGNVFTGNTTADVYGGVQNMVWGDNSFLTSTVFDYTLTVNSATPNAGSRSQWLVSNTNPTTITNLLNGRTGQQVTLIFTTGNTTIQAGTNFLLNGSANQTFTANSTLTLRKRELGQWYEIGRMLQ